MIIGLNGKKGSGKDTVADFLVKEYGFQKIGFAEAMYEAVCALWGISLEEAHAFKDNRGGTLDYVEVHLEIGDTTEYVYSWREHLQRFGTEMGRGVFGKKFWVDQLEERYLGAPVDYVVRDVRFTNEASLLVDGYGADVWQIHRPGFEADGHESEAGIDESYIKGDISNDGTLDELYGILDQWMVTAYGRNPV